MNSFSTPVYFLLHIPKTGGTSIEYHLLEHGAPGAYWYPPAASYAALAVGHPYRETGMPPPADLRALAGHFLGRSLERHFVGRDIRRVVFLRDPVSLQVSLYNYRMMKYLKRGRGIYDFHLHLAAQPRDFVTHTLLSRWLEQPWARLLVMSNAEKYRMINEALRQFWFVGAYTECDRVIAAIANDLGTPEKMRHRNTAESLRKKAAWEPLTVANLPAPLRREIEINNPIDCALWESWRGANFDTAAIEPVRLVPRARTPFPIYELIRPAFQLTRLSQRRWPRRRDVAALARHDER